MPWPFDTRYMQLALFGGVVVGLFAPLVGAFLVQRRLSLFGDGIGHIAFAGVSIGLATSVWPVWTALIAAVVGAVGIEALRSSRRAAADLVLAVFFYGGIAIGVIVASASSSFNAGLLSYLFGSILTVNESDLYVIVVTGVLVTLTMLMVRRSLFAVVTDEEVAKVAGLPVHTLNYVLAIAAAVTVVSAMRVVGLLLVAAMLVLPFAAAQQMARSFWGSVRLSSAVGVLAVAIGLGSARAADVAPGGTIVLVLIVIFVVAAAVATARGHNKAPSRHSTPHSH